jgi:polyribonucleotide nucleotidyltransferase
VKCKVEETVGGETLSIESGEVAKQADGAVIVRYGDTVVLVAAVCGESKGFDFLPMTVDYREKLTPSGDFLVGFLSVKAGPPTRKY